MTAIYHLIIADDDFAIACVLEDMFEGALLVVTTHVVFNGQAVLAAYEVMGADLLVLDIQMPLLTGSQVVQILRARGDTVPVLLISGQPRQHDGTSTDPHTTFFRKPFDVAVLIDTVQQLLPAG